jgi:hypothetical protein
MGILRQRRKDEMLDRPFAIRVRIDSADVGVLQMLSRDLARTTPAVSVEQSELASISTPTRNTK